MTVKFNFDYVLNMHDRNRYINAIERDGNSEDLAYKYSFVRVNRRDIKSITKLSNGHAAVNMKLSSTPVLVTVEKYDEIIDTIKKANIALDIMNKDKVYIFDEFEVNSDELNVIEGWKAMKGEQPKSNKKANGNKRK